MATNVYPCFKCGNWFSTKGEQRKHTCKKSAPVKKQVEKEIKIEEAPIVDAEVETVDIKEEVSPENEIDREEVIASLKEKGIVKDKRSTKGKSNEELVAMLNDIEA